MKCKALFSLKKQNKKKQNFKVSSVVVVNSTLTVKVYCGPFFHSVSISFFGQVYFHLKGVMFVFNTTIYYRTPTV